MHTTLVKFSGQSTIAARKSIRKKISMCIPKLCVSNNSNKLKIQYPYMPQLYFPILTSIFGFWNQVTFVLIRSQLRSIGLKDVGSQLFVKQ
jgi:uncharacterized protein (UPF0333 family)